MHNLRSLMNLLEERGDLVRITKEVNPKFELASLMSQLENQHKAFVFENVKGAKLPLVGGTLTKLERYAEMHKMPNPEQVTRQDHAKVLQDAIDNPIEPKVLNTGAVKEVIKTGDDIDLTELPVPTFFEDDSGPFITAAVGVSRHADTGELNVGMYRSLIIDKKTLSVNASSMSDLRRIYTAAEESGNELPVALAIGVDPSVLMAAAGKPPSSTSEFAVAGALEGDALEMVKCENSDLLVPANAEIVIEGVIDFGEKVEQTLGEFAGQYGPETNPVFRVTAITHRKDAMFYAITGGANPEHNTIGSVAIYQVEKQILDDLKTNFPNILRANVVIEAKIAGPMLQLFLCIDKKNDEEPKELIKAAYASTVGYLPVSMIFKRIVVVDPDIDIYDYNDVEWAVWSRVADESKVMVSSAKSWELERGTKNGMSVRLGIDATMDLEEVDKLKRPIIPNADQYQLEDYL